LAPTLLLFSRRKKRNKSQLERKEIKPKKKEKKELNYFQIWFSVKPTLTRS
jgi:hypothetical protein